MVCEETPPLFVIIDYSAWFLEAHPEVTRKG